LFYVNVTNDAAIRLNLGHIEPSFGVVAEPVRSNRGEDECEIINASLGRRNVAAVPGRFASLGWDRFGCVMYRKLRYRAAARVVNLPPGGSYR
jgi:hypothetical protein